MGRQEESRRSTECLTCLVVTNIPTPYRMHMFRNLHEEFERRGCTFKVLFMAKTEAGRSWRFSPRDFLFPYTIAKGVHLAIGRATWHCNPGAIMDILRRPPACLILSGAWAQPTSAALTYLAALARPRPMTLIWAEANAASIRHQTGVIAHARRHVMRRADGFVVPGRIAEDTIRETNPGAASRFLRLPNMVDEQVFGRSVQDLRPQCRELRTEFGLTDADFILLWPARLQEETKGILNFLRAVSDLFTPQVKVLIAGDGPDRPAIYDWIRAHARPNVRLLGQRSQEEIVKLLAIADALILPSLKDHNPLTAIEGLWAGLPILMSNRCGNWPEVVTCRNGWVVDPGSEQSLRDAMRALLDSPHSELTRMGMVSRGIAEREFSTQLVVREFAEALLDARRDYRIQ
jgi:glycosyltransferase involved in cell wall biosynthesis